MNRRAFLLAAALALVTYHFGPRLLPVVVPALKQPGACVCIVEDPLSRSAEMSILVNDRYWVDLESRQLDKQFYAPDSQDMPGVIREAKRVGIPSLVIIRDGRLLHASTIKGRETVSHVDSIVRRVTGL